MWIFINYTASDIETEKNNLFVSSDLMRLWEIVISFNNEHCIVEMIILLENIVDNSKFARDEVINSNLLTEVMTFLECDTINLDICQNIISLLSNVHKIAYDEPSDYLVERSARTVTKLIIRVDDLDFKLECLRTLSNISNSFYPNIHIIIVESVGTIINLMATDNDDNIKAAAITTFGNLASAKDSLVVDRMVEMGILEIIGKTLDKSHFNLKRKALWCLSNIAAGTKNQIYQLYKAGLLKRVIDYIRDSNLVLVTEAVWCISNCVSGADCDTLIKIFENLDLMDSLVFIFEKTQDEKILTLVLEALKIVFHNDDIMFDRYVGEFIMKGGVDILEALKVHKNTDVVKGAEYILDNFFTENF
jgi:importin subunit alpha-1